MEKRDVFVTIDGGSTWGGPATGYLVPEHLTKNAELGDEMTLEIPVPGDDAGNTQQKFIGVLAGAWTTGSSTGSRS